MTIEHPRGALSVTRATVTDAPVVRALRDHLAEWMVERGIRQWRPGELPLEWIEVCIAFGAVYVVSLDSRVFGSVTVVGSDPMIWGEQAEPAGYIHMLMVERGFAGRGIGRSILEWAERSIAAEGHELVRLDCVAGNYVLRAYYERAGFRFVGTKSFPDFEWASETALYEKRLVS